VAEGTEDDNDPLQVHVGDLNHIPLLEGTTAEVLPPLEEILPEPPDRDWH
jgi:hypothetical protein